MLTIKEKSQLFNYIEPQNNDMISLMNEDELQELLYYINNYYLEYRKSIGFGEKITFGIELEFENENKGMWEIRNILKKRLREIKLYGSWEIKGEFSLTEGVEITSPILTDESYNWNNLKCVCNIISQYASINKNCGGHIHIGTQVLGTNVGAWLKFLKLWSVYENIIYRFVYGEFLNARKSMLKFAEPMAKKFGELYQNLKDTELMTLIPTSLINLIVSLPSDKNQAVSFKNLKDFEAIKKNNTIEFRCPNGTLNPIIWQNNVNFFVNLLLCLKSSRYNDDIVESRKQKNGDKYSKMDCYEEINLQQALEFCDMVFTNNLDKVYFLRQYLKSYEIATSKSLSKAQEFTRKLNI